MLDKAARLFVAVFNGPPWNDDWNDESARARLEDITDNPGFRGVAFVDGGELLAFAVGHVERWHSGLLYLLREMCVRSDLQRQGMGSQLITALEAELADVERCYLLTERDGSAHQFYAAQGYFPDSRQGIMFKRLGVTIRPS